MAGSTMPPVSRIAAGQRLFRVHALSRCAHWYGRKDAQWRWDDPDRRYGVLYLGKSLVGPFAETILRTPAERDILWDVIASKRFSTFMTTRALRLARVHGPGLAWFRTTSATVSADFDPALPGTPYEATQRISAMAHAFGGLDGIQYRSRLDSDALCVALFDRADDAIRLETEGCRLEKDWVRAILRPRGYRLIES